MEVLETGGKQLETKAPKRCLSNKIRLTKNADDVLIWLGFDVNTELLRITYIKLFPNYCVFIPKKSINYYYITITGYPLQPIQPIPIVSSDQFQWMFTTQIIRNTDSTPVQKSRPT